jgi:hypothetical protein
MCCSSYFFSGCVSYVVLVLVRTLLAVSAWNDNGQTQFVHDSGKSDFGCSRDSWPGIFRIPMLLLLISGQISFLSNCTPIMYEVVFCLYLLWVIL